MYRLLFLSLILFGCSEKIADYDGVASPGESGRLIGFTDEHNTRRSAEAVADLVYDDGALQTAAEEWLAELVANQDCELNHNLDSPLGENIAWNKGFESNPGLVMEGWMQEEANYDHDTNSCDSSCGHYLQVMWIDTTSVGCAIDLCDDGAEIWMCTYDPAGNIPGELPF